MFLYPDTHDAEQPVKIVALFVCVQSVSQGTVDQTGRGWTPFAAFTALALQLCVAAQPCSLEGV